MQLGTSMRMTSDIREVTSRLEHVPAVFQWTGQAIALEDQHFRNQGLQNGTKQLRNVLPQQLIMPTRRHCVGLMLTAG